MSSPKSTNWQTEIERLAARDGELYRICQIDFCSEWVRKCESPIEQIFAAHLVNWACWLEYSGNLDKVTLCESPELIGKKMAPAVPADRRVLISAQQQIGAYRVDFFVIGRVGDRTAKIVIECDGHDFHERTKVQAKRDRSRDRSLTLHGFKVLRFTGSELNADPERCFKDFTHLIFSELYETYQGETCAPQQAAE